MGTQRMSQHHALSRTRCVISEYTFGIGVMLHPSFQPLPSGLSCMFKPNHDTTERRTEHNSDICQNGIVLNQTIILKGIGYSKGHTIYQTLWNAGVGNIIVIIAGYLPGFILGNLALEWLPRRVQQAGSSLIIGVLYAVWAGVTDTAAIGGLLALFTVVQFLQNAGPNTTAFLLPIELFPTRVRGTSHGIVAAAGKLGAIITAFGFGNTQEAIGMKGVMGMFAGLSFFIVLLTGLVPETKGYSLEDVENDVIYKKKLLSIHGRDLETFPTGDWASTEESGSKGLTKTATVGFDDTKPQPL